MCADVGSKADSTCEGVGRQRCDTQGTLYDPCTHCISRAQCDVPEMLSKVLTIPECGTFTALVIG